MVICVGASDERTPGSPPSGSRTQRSPLELEANAGVLFSEGPKPAEVLVLASALTYTVRALTPGGQPLSVRGQTVSPRYPS
jgi:hypothetical protein